MKTTEINTQMEFDYEVLGFVAEGENVHNIANFEQKHKNLHNHYHANKADWGVKRNPSGAYGKTLQINNAKIMMEQGIPVEYYNGSAIDGLSYIRAYMKANNYTEEQILAWMFASFILYQKGFDITASEATRKNKTFRFLEYHIQKWNLLRNLYADPTSYFDMITVQIARIFRPVKQMVENNLITSTPGTFKVNLRSDFEYNDLVGKYCIPKALFEELKSESPQLNLYNLQNGSTIMIGNRFALRISQNFNGTYNLINILNDEIVITYPSLAYISTVISGIINGLKQTFYSEFAPEVFVISPKYMF